MISKQSDQRILHQSGSSNSIVIRNSNRKFLVFCAFLLTLLLGSFLQRASSYLPTYELRAYQKAFIGRRFFFKRGVVPQVRTDDAAHEVQRSEHADIDRDEALYCDRSGYRTDVCVARGDVRVLGGTPHARSPYHMLVFAQQGYERIEKLKPYTRKWETSIMNTIDEVMVIKKVLPNQTNSGARNVNSSRHTQGHGTAQLRTDVDRSTRACVDQSSILQTIEPQQYRRSSTQNNHKGLRLRPEDPSDNIRRQKHGQELRGLSVGGDQLSRQSDKVPAAYPITEAAPQHRNGTSKCACEVQHEVPAILFSTGGYTGNVYHEFNDGLIPLFITAQRYPPGRVVLIILEYHDWWMSKYAEVVAQISNYSVIDLAHDKRVHCFPEVTVGLRIHDELAIHAENCDHGASMKGFQSILSAAYSPGTHSEIKQADVKAADAKKRKTLLLISRRSPRALLNEKEVMALAKDIGFSVEVLSPTPRTRMVDIYRAVNRCDVMIGVHGAGMTHLLFMRPGATLIQVVPLGTDWAAATYYGEPAQKLGLNYIAYKVRPRESSLWNNYAPDDPVLVSPESVTQKGWWQTKRVYLEAQDVRIGLARLRVTLLHCYTRAALAV